MSLLHGFAVCPSGLEEPLTAELIGLSGFTEVRPGRGGAQFLADATAIARANLWAAIPTRILVQVGKFQIKSAKELLTGATNVPWDSWFSSKETIRVDLTVGREPKLTDSLARSYAALLIKDGVCDRFRNKYGERPSVDTQHPDIRIWVYIDQNLVTLYLDTSGEPLFKRGWRTAKGEAPLRENLAAALIAMTQWNGKDALLDPFCGSGTLLIEAMRQACGLPPGYLAQAPRSFSAEKFRKNSPMGDVDWNALRKKAKEAIENALNRARLDGLPSLLGSDNDPRLIRIAQENASRALPTEIASAIQWKCQPVTEATPHAASGLILTNPPYGERLEKADEQFDRSFAQVLKQKFPGWQAWVLTDNLKLESAMRLKSSRRIPVFNGDLDCRWMRFDMISGSLR